MLFEVPAIRLFPVSYADTVCMPDLNTVKLKVPVPPVSTELPGMIAGELSVLVKCSVPAYALDKLLNSSSAVTVKSTGTPTAALAGAVITKWVAGPPILVSEKLTSGTPIALAVTLYGPPTVEFAKNGAVATPKASVATDIVVVPLPKTPEGPEPGAVKVTSMPGIGAFAPSLTVTAGANRKPLLIIVDCGVVLAFAVIEPGTGNAAGLNMKALAVTSPKAVRHKVSVNEKRDLRQKGKKAWDDRVMIEFDAPLINL